jgi:hypothetical protein
MYQDISRLLRFDFSAFSRLLGSPQSLRFIGGNSDWERLGGSEEKAEKSKRNNSDI